MSLKIIFGIRLEIQLIKVSIFLWQWITISLYVSIICTYHKAPFTLCYWIFILIIELDIYWYSSYEYDECTYIVMWKKLYVWNKFMHFYLMWWNTRVFIKATINSSMLLRRLSYDLADSPKHRKLQRYEFVCIFTLGSSQRFIVYQGSR